MRFLKESINNIIEITESDRWNEKYILMTNNNDNQQFKSFINELNEYLTLRSFLNGYTIKSSDLSLWSMLSRNEEWIKLSSTISPPSNGPINVLRWFKMIENCQEIQDAKQYIVKQEQLKQKQKQKQIKSKGKKGKQGERNSKQKAEASASWVCI